MPSSKPNCGTQISIWFIYTYQSIDAIHCCRLTIGTTIDSHEKCQLGKDDECVTRERDGCVRPHQFRACILLLIYIQLSRDIRRFVRVTCKHEQINNLRFTNAPTTTMTTPDKKKLHIFTDKIVCGCSIFISIFILFFSRPVACKLTERQTWSASTSDIRHFSDPLFICRHTTKRRQQQQQQKSNSINTENETKTKSAANEPNNSQRKKNWMNRAHSQIAR